MDSCALLARKGFTTRESPRLELADDNAPGLREPCGDGGAGMRGAEVGGGYRRGGKRRARWRLFLRSPLAEAGGKGARSMPHETCGWTRPGLYCTAAVTSF